MVESRAVGSVARCRRFGEFPARNHQRPHQPLPPPLDKYFTLLYFNAKNQVSGYVSSPVNLQTCGQLRHTLLAERLC